jgi:hypothetical protein
MAALQAVSRRGARLRRGEVRVRERRYQPRVLDFARQVLRRQDLLDPGRLVGWGDLGRLSYEAILPEWGRDRGGYHGGGDAEK